MSLVQANPKSQQDFEDQAIATLNSKENYKKEELEEKNDIPIESIKEMQIFFNHKMKRIEFETEVFFHDLSRQAQEVFGSKQIFYEDMLVMFSQLEEDHTAFKFIEALEKIEQLELIFQNHDLMVERQRDFNRMRESLMKLESNFHEDDGRGLDFEFFPSELIREIQTVSKSRAEAMFNIFKEVGMFRFKISCEGWLEVSVGKGKFRERTFEEVKNIDRLCLKMNCVEHIEMMIFRLNLLLRNCLEKISCLCFDFSGRYIANQEAKRFNKCASMWSDKKIELTVDFRECTFESEETPLIFFKNERLKFENLQGFTYLLKNTNATYKTVHAFSELIISRMKNLKQWGFDFCNLPVTTIPGLLDKPSGLNKLHFRFQKTAFDDCTFDFFSREILPGLKDLKELKFELGQTLITNNGLLRFFRGIKENCCAENLKVFGLEVNGTKASDESFRDLALKVLYQMENLEQFELLAEKTLVTDKSLALVGQNIKCFAPNLKVLKINLGYTDLTDDTINALASSVLLMKKMKDFQLLINGTKITDKGMRNLYSSMRFAEVSNFELDCSETAVTNESLILFAEKALIKMTKLKKFAFHANKTKLQQDFIGLEIFFTNLSKAGQLIYDLNLCFDKTNVGDESILMLSETLSLMKNIENLTLCFNQTKLTDKSFGPLFSSFRYFARNLERLVLDLEETMISEKGILQLGNNIAPELRSLKEFKLGLSKTRVGDACLKVLFENLKGTMSNMEALQLCLNGTQVGDKALATFAEESLVRAESLKSLEFWANDTEISNLKVPNLENKSYRDLRTLILSFKGTKLDPESLQALSQQVLGRNTLSLQNLGLFFLQSQINQIYTSAFFDTMAEKVKNVRRFEFELSDIFRDLAIQGFADKVLPNLALVEDFKLSWTSKITSLTFEALCLNAKKTIKNIRTFDISPSSFKIETDVTRNRFEKTCFEFNDMTDFTMEKVIESFKDQLFQVRDFYLNVKGTKVSDGSIKALAGICFLKMLNLESLTLNLDGLEISDEAFCEMCRSLKGDAPRYKLFKISLDIPNLRTVSIVALAKSGLAHMNNLETFELNYNSNPEGLVALFTTMKNCTQKLQSLLLSFSCGRLVPEAVQALAIGFFSDLKSLTRLKLRFFETKIREQDFLLMFSCMRGVLENVKIFDWAVYEEGFTNQTLDSFSLHILPRLKNMESFRFEIVGREGEMRDADESFIRFSKKLQGVGNNIRDLTLRFENTGISNKAIDEFALKTLGNLECLKNLNISFGSNAALNDDSFVNLFDSLGEIVGRLSSLQLELQNTGLTDVGIKKFKEKAVGNIDHLEKFSLDVSGNNLSIKNQSFINNI